MSQRSPSGSSLNRRAWFAPMKSLPLCLLAFAPCFAVASPQLPPRSLATQSDCNTCTDTGFYCWSSSSCTQSDPASASPPTCTFAQTAAISADCSAAILGSCSSCTGAGNVWCADEGFCVTPFSAMFCSSADVAVSSAASCPAPSGVQGYLLTKFTTSTTCSGAAYTVASQSGCSPVGGGGSFMETFCTSSTSAYYNVYSDSACTVAAPYPSTPMTDISWGCAASSGGTGTYQSVTCVAGTYTVPTKGFVLTGANGGSCPVAKPSFFLCVIFLLFCPSPLVLPVVCFFSALSHNATVLPPAPHPPTGMRP